MTAKFYQPRTCDEHGNTNYPWIIEGSEPNERGSITVIAPKEFAERWPTVNVRFMKPSASDVPRNLKPYEVLRLCGKDIEK